MMREIRLAFFPRCRRRLRFAGETQLSASRRTMLLRFTEADSIKKTRVYAEARAAASMIRNEIDDLVEEGTGEESAFRRNGRDSIASLSRQL